MKRIEVRYNPTAYQLRWGVYQINPYGTRAFLLCMCLTEDIANKTKEALEK